MAQRKCTLYVGGLSPEVSEELLHATFIPFGDIKSIQIPKDFSESKSLVLTKILKVVVSIVDSIYVTR